MTLGCRWTLAAVVCGAALAAPGIAEAQMQCDPCTVGVVLASAGETPRLCRGGTQSLTIPGVE